MRRERREAQRRLADSEMTEVVTAHIQAQKQKDSAVTRSELDNFMARLKNGGRRLSVPQ